MLVNAGNRIVRQNRQGVVDGGFLMDTGTDTVPSVFVEGC